MARIVSIGSALQDIFLIDHDDFGTNTKGFFNQLELGAKVDIDKIKYSTGGGATNAATTFARNGHESIFFGCISRDSAGQAILNSLDDEGIDSSYVTFLDREHTGSSIVILPPSGERTILTCRGASSRFDALEPNDLDDVNPDWLYVTTFRGDMDMLDHFFMKARSLKTKIMFNPGNLELKHPRKLIGLLSDVEVLLVNKKEAQQIVEGHLLTELVSKLASYVPKVIITDGSQGGIATDGEEIYRFGIYEDVKVKDATGAGDAFGSGFLAAYANGKSFKDSLIFASANSTSVIQHIGSKDGIIGSNVQTHAMPIQEIR